MDKKKATYKMIERFKDIKNLDKIIFYNNPNRFNHFRKESVNPDHIHIVYGQYKRKIAKNKKSGYIKVAKVILNNFIIIPNMFISSLLYYLSIVKPEILIPNLICITTYLFMLYFVIQKKESERHGTCNNNIYNNNSFIHSIFPRKNI